MWDSTHALIILLQTNIYVHVGYKYNSFYLFSYKIWKIIVTSSDWYILALKKLLNITNKFYDKHIA